MRRGVDQDRVLDRGLRDRRGEPLERLREKVRRRLGVNDRRLVPGGVRDHDLGDLLLLLGESDRLLLNDLDLRPGDLRPGDLRPGDLPPGDLRPGDLRPGDFPPGDLRPGDLRPGDLRPADLRPGDLLFLGDLLLLRGDLNLPAGERDRLSRDLDLRIGVWDFPLDRDLRPGDLGLTGDLDLPGERGFCPGETLGREEDRRGVFERPLE